MKKNVKTFSKNFFTFMVIGLGILPLMTAPAMVLAC